jgi:hypothetical protein
MGQCARFDDSEKARFVDDASIGVNDDPVVGEESIERVRVIIGDRSRKFVFQFYQFFLHRIFEKKSKLLTRKRSATASPRKRATQPRCGWQTRKPSIAALLAVRCIAWLDVLSSESVSINRSKALSGVRSDFFCHLFSAYTTESEFSSFTSANLKLFFSRSRTDFRFRGLSSASIVRSFISSNPNRKTLGITSCIIPLP